MRPVLGIRRQRFDRPDIAAQLVCYDDTRVTKTVNQSLKETPCSLRISVRLNKTIQDITIGINCPPQPELTPVYRDHDLVEMPFVVGNGPIPFHALSKVRPKLVHPFATCLATDHKAPFCQKILDIRSAESEPIICPDSIRNDFTWVTEALQARHFGRYLHAGQLCEIQ